MVLDLAASLSYLAVSKVLGGSSLDMESVNDNAVAKLMNWANNVFVLAWTIKMSKGCSPMSGELYRVAPALTPNVVSTLMAKEPTISSAANNVANKPNKFKFTCTLTARRNN
jgi:hypothetical protein